MRYVGGPWHFLPRALQAVLRKLGMQWSTLVHRYSLASLGAGSRIQWGVRFGQPSVVQVGANCFFWTGVRSFADYPGQPLVIGDRVEINAGVYIDTTGGLRIGNDVLISEQVAIYTHDHGLDPHSRPTAEAKNIDDGAWIGMRAIILPKCRRIGRSAVIGAGSVVTKDVPDFAIVAGNPARIVGMRTAKGSDLVQDEAAKAASGREEPTTNACAAQRGPHQ